MNDCGGDNLEILQPTVCVAQCEVFGDHVYSCWIESPSQQDDHFIVCFLVVPGDMPVLPLSPKECNSEIVSCFSIHSLTNYR